MLRESAWIYFLIDPPALATFNIDSMKEAFETNLRQAWTLRNSQQLDAAEQVYRELCGFMIGEDGLANGRLELKLLEASLLRGRQRIEESEAKLLEAKSQIEKDNLKIPFQYYCQRGLNLFYQGYFPSALEFFARGQELAENIELKAVALGNHFLCLDNLNLPMQNAVKDLKALQNLVPKNYFSQVILPQLETFERRQSFRQGAIAEVFVKTATEFFSQAHYVQLWVSQLPYVSHENAPQMIELIQAPHFLWKNYRLRTLSLDGRYNDEDKVKISERVDRLYIWLWKWMASPAALPNTMLEDCWRALDPAEICSQTTAEDLVMLRLCLRWARLFDTRWEIPSQEWLKKSIPPHIKDPPVFQYESFILDYLEELKGFNRTRARALLLGLLAHPFYADPSLQFRELINGISGKGKSSKPLFILGETLADNLRKKTLKASARVLVIDLQSHHWRYGSLEGVSKPLCYLLKSLHEIGNLSFHELMQNCFGIPDYNEDLHRHKVMNLLTRARKILPEDFKIFTRDQRVYSKGRLHKKIRFENSEGNRIRWELPRIFERPCLKQNQYHMDRWIQPTLVVKKLEGKNKVTRQELQDLLKLSKATTNRLLRRWTNEGFLIKQGAVRSISYHIDRTYFFRLKSSDS